jgi:2-polyprenyl-3-methyl-5-hydroxy-6-metoxy-1,4-benzoquinol methylase
VCGELVRKTLLYSQRFTMPSVGGIHAGYDVVACDRCGFTFADAPPSQEFFDSYYRAMAKKDEMLDPAADYAESAETVARNDHSAAQIIPQIRSGDRVLDIGCYTGYLLSVIARKVPDAILIGLDPSSFAAGVGKRRHDVDIRVGTVFDDMNLGTFDVVIACHVLEHVADVRPFLATLRGLLAPQGKLYLEVPDAAGFSCRAGSRDQRAEPFFEFNFEHINYFTATSLEYMLDANGFRAVSVASRTSTLPVLASVWTEKPLKYDPQSAANLSRYVEESRAIDAGVETTIRHFAERVKSYCVWGAGAHTQRLLARRIFEPRAIPFFVDSNSALQGATLAGRPILSPATLSDHANLPVVISSFRHEREIRARLIAEGRPNEILTLYGRFDEQLAAN